MIAEIIIYAAVGILLVVLGLLLWKKQKITLIHDYHCRNVQPEDVPAYTKSMGIGLIIIGAGMCAMGALRILTDGLYAWLAFLAGFAAGLVVMHRAQKRYNGSWFS